MSSPHEVLAKLATLIDGEFDDAGDEVTTACEFWVYGPRLVAIARAALGLLADHDAANRDADIAGSDMVPVAWAEELGKDRDRLRSALTALGGPDA